MITWTTPAGKASKLCLDILKQPHCLIAGATGAGKSVLINSTIYTALYSAPCAVGFVLIDPKRVELVEYANLPHCLRYASEPDEIAAALVWVVGVMEQRYKSMQAAHVKRTDAREIYIIIDEFADLMTTQKRQALPLLQRLAQLGRAAGIHLILATQRPTRDIIDGKIKVNIDARMALRCPTAQDSRNIINANGAEALPRIGQGYYLTPDTVTPQRVDIPYTAPETIAERVNWWISQLPPRKWWQFWK